MLDGSIFFSIYLRPVAIDWLAVAATNIKLNTGRVITMQSCKLIVCHSGLDGLTFVVILSLGDLR